MKYVFLIPLAVAALATQSHAQTRIFRCGNTYTNHVAEAQAKGCKPMEGGNITVVEGTRPPASGSTPKANARATPTHARSWSPS